LYPASSAIEGQDFTIGLPIPKRVTQLTIQQAEVLYVGTWYDPLELKEDVEAEVAAGLRAPTDAFDESSTIPGRLERLPDVVILSMSSQDALALNWAMIRGVDINLALRSPGDQTVFVTTSVSLPQIIDQGGLAIPEQSNFDLHPSMEDVLIPSLPPWNVNEAEAAETEEQQ
jgi:hypothetical protein